MHDADYLLGSQHSERVEEVRGRTSEREVEEAVGWHLYVAQSWSSFRKISHHTTFVGTPHPMPSKAKAAMQRVIHCPAPPAWRMGFRNESLCIDPGSSQLRRSSSHSDWQSHRLSHSRATAPSGLPPRLHCTNKPFVIRRPSRPPALAMNAHASVTHHACAVCITQSSQALGGPRGVISGGGRHDHRRRRV